VRFPGPVSEAEKREIFAAADIHAMPSVQLGEMIEGFGIVFHEAAAA
jgi:phosphatidylinositol alpha-1,6-mannosyltransferase